MVEAKPNLYLENASNVVLHGEFPSATQVEGSGHHGVHGLPAGSWWVVFNGEIIDLTLPVCELFYLPTHQWMGKAFPDVLFKCGVKSYFKRSDFKLDAVQGVMDKARAAAAALAAT